MNKVKSQAENVVKSLLSPVERFLALETAGGILLIIATIVAMLWANSPWYHSYEHFIHFPISLSLGGFVLEKTLHHWVNDGLMVIFFFVVGLEIKRELVNGELSTPKKAALPMLAALGGMVVPAGFYALLNIGGPGQHGWGVPMATDIAFAVGVVTMFNKKVPFSLKVFLLALAIVDDLGAVIVIATFYTEQIHSGAIGFAALCIGLITLFKLAGVRKLPIYVVLSVAVWLGILESGIHATIAGVIVGFLTPIEPFADKIRVLNHIDQLAEDIGKKIPSKDKINELELDEGMRSELYALGYNIKHIESPLERLIHFFHPWVSYAIMPIFALVNAGVHIDKFNFGEFITQPISMGIVMGLFLGKPVGVILFSYIAVKFNLARLPRGTTWTQMLIMGFLAGIGFTMALFVSGLAFDDAASQTHSKLGILVASFMATMVGGFMLAIAKPITAAQQKPNSQEN